MPKFIEVTIDGSPALVNINRIEGVEKEGDGSVIHMTSNYYPENKLHAEESYEKVRSRIYEAGGI